MTGVTRSMRRLSPEAGGVIMTTVPVPGWPLLFLPPRTEYSTEIVWTISAPSVLISVTLRSLCSMNWKSTTKFVMKPLPRYCFWVCRVATVMVFYHPSRTDRLREGLSLVVNRDDVAVEVHAIAGVGELAGDADFCCVAGVDGGRDE